MESDQFQDGLPRLATASMDDLAREFRENGEKAFRRVHSHPFLVVVYTPSSDMEPTDSNTMETQIDRSEPDRRRRMGKRVIPLIKSNPKSKTSRITIGRSRDNDIVIPASKISKAHAAFVVERGGRYRLMDVGSVNGTIVNRVRLDENKMVKLKSGDMVALWLYLFQFVEFEPFLVLLGSTPT